jgi:hypothetical protein
MTILFVNGDSHAAGAEINNRHCFAADDPVYPENLGPHPDNICDSFGYLLADQLKFKFKTDARSGCDNNRIIRTTRDFISETNEEIFILIGWPTFERKEMFIEEKYYYFGPGFHSSKNHINQLNKQYVASLDSRAHTELTNQAYEKIYEFHCELQNQKIKHLFFNTYQWFKDIDQQLHYDWNNCFIGAYNKADVYWHWLQSQGFGTVNGGYHYGAAAHYAWANRLHNWLTDHHLL